MAATTELSSAIEFLQSAVVELENRLLSYTPGEFDEQIAIQTQSVSQITDVVNAMAPVGATAGALELTAVT